MGPGGRDGLPAGQLQQQNRPGPPPSPPPRRQRAPLSPGALWGPVAWPLAPPLADHSHIPAGPAASCLAAGLPPSPPSSPRPDKARWQHLRLPWPQPGSQPRRWPCTPPSPSPWAALPAPQGCGPPCPRCDHHSKGLPGQPVVVLSPGPPPSGVSARRSVLCPCPSRPGHSPAAWEEQGQPRLGRAVGTLCSQGMGEEAPARAHPPPGAGESPDGWGAWGLLRLFHSRAPQTAKVLGPSQPYSARAAEAQEAPGRGTDGHWHLHLQVVPPVFHRPDPHLAHSEALGCLHPGRGAGALCHGIYHPQDAQQ
ncbi:basic proline-rich protein-like isoform X2 [Eumetopias jubatus]|uniref:basic proline-rich protein-like isoform X2 n=1 Tax=Eumetopias jubatus TaxID=34886 RepID=UPI001016C728|nr:basic proline-rich protein-like isoform X2 [Eumetopias jubatus]